MSGTGAKEVSGRNFLRLGTAAGLAAASVPILASCGKELPKVKNGKVLIAEKKLEPNSAYVFAGAETDDPRVVVRLESGDPDVLGGMHGRLQGRGATPGLPLHDSIFSPSSGKVASGPADEPLAKLDVKVANGKIIYA